LDTPSHPIRAAPPRSLPCHLRAWAAAAFSPATRRTDPQAADAEAPAPADATGGEAPAPADNAEAPAPAPAEEPAPAEAPAPADGADNAEAPAPGPDEGGAAAEAPEPAQAGDSKVAADWAQCGGSPPGQPANATWTGPAACGANATCVFITNTFHQCIPLEKSRGYGCSAPYSQCGGTEAGVNTMWSGPYCCGASVASECVQFSDSYSQCKPCNGLYEQCGGTIPRTDVSWNGHGRAACAQPPPYHHQPLCAHSYTPQAARPAATASAVPPAGSSRRPRRDAGAPSANSASAGSHALALPLLSQVCELELLAVRPQQLLVASSSCSRSRPAPL